MLCFLHLAERLSRWRGTKPYLAGLPLSQALSGRRLPQPLGQTFPLESTPGGGNVPQDTEAGEGRHCEPCLAKSHGEALGYSDGVAAPGERVHFPHPREAGRPVLHSLGAHSGGGNWRAKLLQKSLQGDPPQPRKALEARDKLSRIRPKARTLAGCWGCPATQTPECSPPDLETPGLPYGVSISPPGVPGNR